MRQGPILWENLRRSLQGEPLVAYGPQRDFLSLLAIGEGRALLSYYGLSAGGRWCWRWKDRIDRRFMAMFQQYPPPVMAGEMAGPGERRGGEVGPESAGPRCTGCGGKIAGSVLSRVFSRLEIPESSLVERGLEAPDDAAVVAWPVGRQMLATVDFFAAFVDDAYLVGRVAALHAAADTLAMGGRPRVALAHVTLPVGTAEAQEALLFELLSGMLRELRAMGATLVGGHTIEGQTTTVGLTLLGEVAAGKAVTKAGLRVGDVLVLTKALGTGVLLAGHMRAMCRGTWMDALRASLLAGHMGVAECLEAFDVRAATDVTGFGLAGHLAEMLAASGQSAELELDQVPVLPGAAELLAGGLRSTLAAANRRTAVPVEFGVGAAAVAAEARRELLFDPQTSGGLLLALPAERADAALVRLSAACETPVARIGRVVAAGPEGPRLVVV